MTPADYAIIAASLGILGLYLLLALLRGTLKFILIVLSTTAGGFSAYATLHFLPRYVGRLLRETPDWTLPLLAAMAGILAFFFVKTVLSLIFRPLSFGADSSSKKTGGIALTRCLIAIIFGIGLAWGAGILLRYAGTLASLRLADADSRGEQSQAFLWKIDYWHQQFNQSSLGEWHRKLDPLAQPGQAHAAQLAIRLRHGGSLPQNLQADLEDAAWRQFIKQIDSPRIQSLIESGDYSSLLKEVPLAPKQSTQAD